jgi:hypothetical protein
VYSSNSGWDALTETKGLTARQERGFWTPPRGRLHLLNHRLRLASHKHVAIGLPDLRHFSEITEKNGRDDGTRTRDLCRDSSPSEDDTK